VSIRLGPQIAGGVEDGWRQRAMDAGGGHMAEGGVTAKEGVRDELVFFRLTRAGRVDQPPARSDGLGGVVEHPPLSAFELPQIFLAAAPPDIRIPTQCPETGAWRVDDHAIEALAKWQRLQQIRLNHEDAPRAGRRDRVSQQLNATIAHVARNQTAVCGEGGRDRGRFAARRCAGVEDARTRRIASEQRHELRGFVLDDEHTLVRCAERPPAHHSDAVRSVDAGLSLDILCFKMTLKLVAVHPESIGAKRERCRRVVEAQPRFGRVETEAREPALDEPARMGQRDTEVIDRGFPVLD
jgi:hypothetical protein